MSEDKSKFSVKVVQRLPNGDLRSLYAPDFCAVTYAPGAWIRVPEGNIGLMTLWLYDDAEPPSLALVKAMTPFYAFQAEYWYCEVRNPRHIKWLPPLAKLRPCLDAMKELGGGLSLDKQIVSYSFMEAHDMLNMMVCLPPDGTICSDAVKLIELLK